MNKMRLFAFMALAMSLCGLTAVAQQDTVFVDEWGGKQLPSNARYFRVIQYIDSGRVHVHQYHLSHTLHFSGFYSNPQCNMPHGKFIYYSPEGFRTSEGDYHKGFRTGCWLFYDEEGKSILEKHCYGNPGQGYYLIRYLEGKEMIRQEGQVDEAGKKTGLWKEYFLGRGEIHLISNFANGIRSGEQLEFYPGGQLKRREIVEGFRPVKGERFDENGKQLAYYPAFSFPKPPETLKRYLSLRVDCFDKLLKAHDIHYRLKVYADGGTSEIELPELPDDECKTKLIGAISRMKRWTPAKRENIPIDYKVDGVIKYHVPKD